MEIIVKLNNETNGRDKLIRLIQYLSKLAWYRTEQIHLISKHTVDVLRHLEYTLGTFRKLLRFGKCLDSFYAASKLMSHPDSKIRVILCLSKISNALFLLGDHFLWLSRSGLVQTNTEKWSQFSNKYWLLQLTMNLLRDFCEIKSILKNESIRCVNNFKDLAVISSHCFNRVLAHQDVCIDTLKNFCDFWIPLTTLGYTKLSPGTIGLLGSISSILALITIVDPMTKLTPS